MRFVAYSWYITCTGTCTLFSTSTTVPVTVYRYLIHSGFVPCMVGCIAMFATGRYGTVDCAVFQRSSSACGRMCSVILPADQV